tara:strand:- start:536 stop:1099 length:564 start_codon:yes stop_codon:yes gene_type:complete
VTAQPTDEIARVVQALCYDGVGCVVVVDGGRATGVRRSTHASRLVSSRLVSGRFVSLSLSLSRGLTRRGVSFRSRERQIATKLDALEWWMEKLSMECLVGAVANKTVVSASPGMSRDEVASAMTRGRAHHAVVTDSEGFFLGIVSSWDVARDVGRGWELPFWEEFFDRVRRPRIRGGGGDEGRAAAA